MRQCETLISASELQSAIDLDDWRVMDCRFDLLRPEKGRQDYLSGHIPGAVHADLDKDLADPVRKDSGRHPLPDPDRFARVLGGWGISNSSQVVAYDHASGAIASRLWWLLRWLGHSRVAVLDGGIEAWSRAGGMLSTESARPVGATFRAVINNALVLSTAELLRKPGSIQLVDARDRERYLGRSEPIDAIAGHVPGARNLPFSESLRPDGRFLEPQDLRTRWRSVLGDTGEAPWAAMCGSGVTACHLALSAEIAGIRPPRLYAGSWSEWIRDPDRPVATEAG
jgi:thiosulfate/3-mercaptopyruvate sulfurtransferase